jgi:hydrogenase nickel incorporation protein HypA/HybF
VHKDALEFSFEVAARGTPLEGARLVIEELPVAIFCAACGETVELPGIQALRCPRCGAPSADVRQGDELELWSLEFSEES